MFKNQPKGLYALALANTGERFGYYTMIAVFSLFLGANFGLSESQAGVIYSVFLALVYFLPVVGGALADRFGYGRMVTIGIVIMFLGYLILSIPLGGGLVALLVMALALILISFGTGLFKGNLQVMVGNLYDDPQYSAQRDSGFSLFYMAINIGALFAPTAAVKIKAWAETIGFESNEAYHFSFAVACVALIISIAIYYIFRGTFRQVEGGHKKTEAAQPVAELSPEETRKRIVALCLVFAVVIFFWMAFQQNGLTLTFFADQFTHDTDRCQCPGKAESHAETVERAVEYEIKRQSKLLDAGEKVIQETRGWNDATGKTTGQRSKEEARELSRRGGVKSGQTRRWKGNIKAALMDKLGEDANMTEFVNALWEALVDEHNLDAAKFIRDTTDQAPVTRSQQQLTGADGGPLQTEIVMNFVRSNISDGESEK